MRKKLEENPEKIFQLPTLKMVIEEIEANTEDGEPLYQNRKVYYYSREKQFIKYNCVEIVDTIINCYEKRYDNLFASKSNLTVNVNLDQGDTMLFEIWQILNCNLWPSIEKESNNDDPNQAYSVQRGALLRLFECYKQMKSLDCYDENYVSDSFFAIVCCAVRYFNVQKVNHIDFWSKILSFKEEHEDWKPASLLIEICLYVSFSNAVLERFFSQMNLIKTALRNRLTNEWNFIKWFS